MAATAAGARLTEAHRLAQLRIGAQTVRDMLLLWDLIDPTALDVTMPTWQRFALQLIAERHSASAFIAGDYLRAFRAIEAPTAAPFAPIFGRLDLAAATTSLEVTGPVSLKRAMTAGADLAKAAETAKVNTARAGMRHVLDGGRSTITATTAADPALVGYRRVTSGDACKFCSMLAGRGAVYSASTSRFQSHDGCSCSAEPVYETN